MATTPKTKTELDSCYTRMLRTVLNDSWQHMTNYDLYGNLPKSAKRYEKGGRAPKIILWAPNHGDKKPGGTLKVSKQQCRPVERGRTLLIGDTTHHEQVSKQNQN